jgi:hypothetical protein
MKTISGTRQSLLRSSRRNGRRSRRQQLLSLDAMSQIESLEDRTLLSSGPSAFGHITDGKFDIINGHQEWADIIPTFFPQSHSYLYADQANLNHPAGSAPDTFMLMYDDVGLTTPLGPNQFVPISFSTVETESGHDHLNQYDVHVFTDGTITFFENGIVQADANGNARVQTIGGQTGQAGFGPSPNSSTPHVIAEFQIALSAHQSIVNGGYSPDPLFWSSDPPPPPHVSPVATDDTARMNVSDPSVTINVLSNDTDAEGTIDPTTVTIVSQPQNGTARVNGDGSVTYSPTASFSGSDTFSYVVSNTDEDVSNTASVEVDQIISAGVAVPVTLPQVTAAVPLAIKPYVVTYGSLPLTFTSSVPSGPAFATFQSNVATLSVFATVGIPTPPGSTQILIATSTASASLTFFKAKDVNVPSEGNFTTASNNILLNSPPGPLDQVAEWTTPGFEIKDTPTNGHVLDHDTGPLTFWVNLAPLVSSDAPIATKVQAAETFIHTTLIAHLSAIDSLAMFQDPPSNVLVTDPNGLQTGETSSGQIVDQIPGSLYFTTADLTVVVIVDPIDGTYQTQVIGTPLAAFSFSESRANFVGDVTTPLVAETDETGTLGSGGVNTYSFVLTMPPLPLPLTPVLPGFNSNALPANDDASSGAVPLGFTIDFFGQDYSSLFVNNNGNVTFDSPLGEFTPFDLTSTQHVIMAPFFADVDTRVGNVVTYGTGMVGGDPAFVATWPGVGYFSEHTDKLNTLQLVLIDRSDTGAGNFDIEFNYGQIQWETGDASGGSGGLGGASARVGFSNGTGVIGTFFELPGSGVNGAFVDNNLQTGLIHNSAGSQDPGQYIFNVRGGTPLVHQTAAILQANLDGTTSVTPTNILVGQGPSLLDELVQIIQFRLDARLTNSVMQLTDDLVNGLVEEGLVPQEQAAPLITNVVQRIVEPPLITSPSDQTSIERSAHAFDLGSFNDTGTGSWNIDVNWGDGTLDSMFDVTTTGVLGTQSHTFSEEGIKTVTVTVTDTADSLSSSVEFQVNVADPSVVATGVSVHAVERGLLSGVAVATFTDPAGPESAADYSAAIDWGDGTPPSAGIIGTPNAQGVFTVTGNHTYSEEGVYAVTVTIDHDLSRPTVVTTSAQISKTIRVLLLDPSNPGALVEVGSGGIRVTGGGALIVDSNSADAGIQFGSGNVSAAEFDVTGTLLHVFGTGNFIGSVDRRTATPDPLSGLPVPPVAGTVHTAVFATGRQSITLSPGVYIGGIHIFGSASIVLLPGTYILQRGGLTITGNGKLTGNDVMIYNASTRLVDQINLSGNASITLSAPTSGTYRGVVLFQNRLSSAPIVVVGKKSTFNLTGVVYAPRAAFVMVGSPTCLIQGNSAAGIGSGLIVADLANIGSGALTVNASANGVPGVGPFSAEAPAPNATMSGAISGPPRSGAFATPSLPPMPRTLLGLACKDFGPLPVALRSNPALTDAALLSSDAFFALFEQDSLFV